MQGLGRILEEIDETIERYGKNPYIDEKATELCYGMTIVKDIIRKHMDNDGWIPVGERLPEEKEWKSYDKKRHCAYMKRMEIAYMTDTVEYTHGYYDGYKWMNGRLSTIKNVMAWRVHEPYRPERSEDETQKKTRCL